MGGESKIFFCHPMGLENFHLDLLRARWRNLVYVEWLYMIKSMVIGFCFIGGWCYSECQWVLDWRTPVQFQGSEMSLELFQDFMVGYIKP